MAGKSRQSANLTSKNNIFVDAVADNTGIGSTSPKSKLDVVGNARISGILTVGVSSSVTIDGNAGIVSATKLYADGIDVTTLIGNVGYANTSGIATVATTALGIVSTANINTTGIITAASFFGDGSLLSNISVGIRSAGTFVGTATTIDFGTSNIAITTSRSGIVTVGISSNVIVGEYQPTIFKNYDLWFSLLDVAGFTTLGTSDASGTWQANGGATLSTNSATLLTSVNDQTRSVVHSREITSNQYYGMEITFRSSISGTADAIGFALWNYNSTNLSTIGGGSGGSGINATSNMFGVYLNFYSSVIQIQGVNGTVNTSYSGSNIIGTHIWKITLSGSDYLSMNVSVYRNNILVASRSGVQMPLSSRFAFGGGAGGLNASATVDQVSITYTASGTPNMYQAYVHNSVNNSWKSYSPTYATVSQISGISSGITTTANINTAGIITASRFVGVGSGLTGVIGVSTQWITTSVGIHTLSKVGIGTTNPLSTLEVFGNVNVAGTSGQLFSVVDSLATGSIFSVNDISGIPSIDVNADGTIQLSPFNGRIGIGTTNAGAALDVLGSGLQLRLANKGSNSGYSYIQFGRSSTASQNWHFGSEGNQYFNIWNGNFGSGIGPLISLYSPGSTTSHSVLINYGFNVAPTGTSNQPLQINGGSYISGNVGIGATNPTSRLQVFGSAFIGFTTAIATSTPSRIDTGNNFSDGTTRDKCKIYLYNSGTSQYGFGIGANGDIQHHSNQTHDFYINNTQVLRIATSGFLGIGTNNPSSRLDVRGGAIISGVVTAPSFVGNLTGTATTATIATSLTNDVNINTTGTISASSFVGNLTGTATTATSLTSNADINTTGILTATKFVGDGSGLTGIVATSGGGVFIQNDNVNIGAASTINFTNNFVVESAAGIATVGFNTASTITAAAFIGDGSGLTNISGGGGGASSRTVVSGITTVLAVNGIGNTEISGFKSYALLKVGVSTASWVRLYTDSISRSNDASRSIEVDPTTGSGVIAEVATTGISTVKITPFLIGFNDDNPITNTIYVSVKNLSGISTSISVNLTILKMEE